jgi:protein-L-isoaspartate O-methyltransferase
VPAFTAELELLLTGVRQCVGTRDADALTNLLAQVNWVHVLWLGHRHRLLLFLQEALSAAARDCPPRVLEQLAIVRECNNVRSLARARELRQLQELFDRHGVPVISVGGWTFGQCFYPRADLREVSGSTEYLIHEGDRARAEAVLVEAGYSDPSDPLRLFHPDRSHVTFIERLASTASPPDHELWSQAVSVSIAGRQMATLSPRHWLVYMCGRTIETSRPELRRFVDVAAILTARTPHDWSAVRIEAKRAGLEEAVIRSVAVSRRLFGQPQIDPTTEWTSDRQELSETAPLIEQILTAPAEQPSSSGDLPAHAETDLAYLGRFATTPPGVVQAMLRLAGTGPDDVVYDLGCGDGRAVVAAAKLFGAASVGIEIDGTKIRAAKEAAEAAGVGDRVKLVCGDILKADIYEATVIIIYLQAFAYDVIYKTLLAQLRPGVRVVSHDMIFPGWPPENVEIVRSNFRRASYVYLWRT